MNFGVWYTVICKKMLSKNKGVFMDVKDILTYCDHTLLSQTATWDDIKATLDDAIKYKTASACIPPSFVARAKEYVCDKLKICTVIGFPNGYNTTAVKVFETEDAVENGADEIDMVINIGELKARNYDYLKNEKHCVKIDDFDEKKGNYTAYFQVTPKNTKEGFSMKVSFKKDSYTVHISDNANLEDALKED